MQLIAAKASQQKGGAGASAGTMAHMMGGLAGSGGAGMYMGGGMGGGVGAGVYMGGGAGMYMGAGGMGAGGMGAGGMGAGGMGTAGAAAAGRTLPGASGASGGYAASGYTGVAKGVFFRNKKCRCHPGSCPSSSWVPSCAASSATLVARGTPLIGTRMTVRMVCLAATAAEVGKATVAAACPTLWRLWRWMRPQLPFVRWWQA